MTTTTQDVTARDQKLNEAVLAGKALEAFDEYYADDVVMQENNNPPFTGKATNRKREEDFFGGIAEVHDVKLLSSAAQGEVSFGEWLFDVTFKDGKRYRLEQVSVRRWKNGQVVFERFYYKG